MYSIWKLILITLMAVCLYSCSDSTDNNVSPTQSNPERKFKYPVKLNSYWYYGTRNFIFNIRPDSINIYFSTDTIPGYGNSAFEKDTVVNSDTLTLFRNVLSTSGHAVTTNELYKQTDTGLIRIAHYTAGSNFGPFRSANNFSYSHNGKSFSDLNDLFEYFTGEHYQSDTSFYFDDPPVKVLQYPVTENTEWNFFNNGSSSINKTYLNYENVTVNAGTFFCIKLKRDLFYNSVKDTNYIYYDYFSASGMVKRDILIKDVNVSNQFGQTIGKIDVKEEVFVNLYNIP